jgi:hypothetical protein
MTMREWFPINPDVISEYPITIFFNHDLIVFSIFYTPVAKDDVKYIIENMVGNLPPPLEITSIHQVTNFQINRLYPNPFNPVLNIDFEINQAGLVEVKISDISGSMVKTVYEGFEGAGKHQISWNSEILPSGVYFVSLQAGGNSLTKKVVLLK